eukprot:scaffold1129_cov100-Isochrysis_galbana.AAC.3
MGCGGMCICSRIDNVGCHTLVSRHNRELEPYRHRDDPHAGEALHEPRATEGVFKVKRFTVKGWGLIP